MTFQKFKTNSYCIGGRHHSSTANITVYISINEKTGKEVNFLISRCSICNRKKSMTVIDNTIQAEGLGDFFKNLGKVFSKAAKKLARNAIKNTSRFLEIGAIVAAATASRNLKAALSTIPEVINIYHTGKGLYLPRFALTYIRVQKLTIITHIRVFYTI